MKWNWVLNILQLLFVVALTLFVAGKFAPLGVDPHHDGIMMKPAIDMLHGKTLFKDSFTQYGALSTLIQTTSLKLFGEHLIVIKYLTVAFYGGIAALLWIVWSIFLPSPLATLTVLIWVGLFGFYKKELYIFLAWSSVYALFAQMLSIYFLIMWAKWKKPALLFCVGVCAAAAFWFRQPAGIYIFASVFIFWFAAWIKKVKLPSLFPLIIGFLFVHLLFFYWLIQNGSLTYWWAQSIGFAASWAHTVALQYRFPIFQISKLLPLSYSAVSIWVLFPAAVLYQGYILLKQKKLSPTHLQLLAAVCVSLFSWLQYYPQDDPRHCFWAATPMMGFFVYSAWYNKNKGLKHFIIFCLFLLFLAPDIFNGLRNASNKLEVQYYTFTGNTVLKGMKENKQNYLYFQSLIKAIREEEKQRPDTFVLSATADALYSLLGKNIMNCSRYYVDWRWGIYDKNIEKIYTSETRSCIQKYKPLILTDSTHYNPPRGYKRVTDIPVEVCNEYTAVNYLLAPIR
jgi:hypothetical protein